MTHRLDQQVAIITGASRGIGRAIAEAYAAEGASLCLVATDTGTSSQGLPVRVRIHAAEAQGDGEDEGSLHRGLSIPKALVRTSRSASSTPTPAR